MPGTANPKHRAALHFLVIASGFAALVHEVLWLRGFAIILGSTLHSMSCVLTAFMMGLAIGGGLARRFLRASTPHGPGVYIRWYGILELVIGLYGLALTPSLFLWQEGYLQLLARLPIEGPLTRLAAHFALSLVLLLVPTACMGATLPVLCMSLPRSLDTSTLYGFNTLGAALGSLGASFLLIYLFGCLAAVAIVAGLGLLVFLAAMVLSARPPTLPAEDGLAAEESAPKGDAAPWPAALIVGLSCFSGYVFFSFELVWDRCFSMLLGNRVYVSSITLFFVLACLAVGAWVSRRTLARRPPEAVLFGGYAAAILSMAVGVLLTARALHPTSPSPATTALFVLALILLPATAMGALFPALLSLPVPRSARGAHVGLTYAANALGSVLGSLLTGYLLIDRLGSHRVILANGGLLLLSLAVAAACVGRGRRLLRLDCVVAGVLLVAATFRCWNEPIATVDPATTLVLEEDEYGVFSVSPRSEGRLSVRNNSTELVFLFGHPETQFVQETQAHVPMLFAPSLGRVLVIGSGYGITAGAFGAYPVERVDAVEILPLMVEHGGLFRSRNHGYQENPRVRVHVADGRHFLATSHESYDVVSINVSDPYVPGSSSLFSAEFYALVAERLAPGGVVCQHVFGPDAASLYHGFKDRFPYVEAIPAYRNGLSLIGSRTRLEIRNPTLADDPRIRSMLAAIGIDGTPALRGLLDRGRELVAELDAAPRAFTNSDVDPALEFRRSPDVDLLFSQH